jgi:hypothetical protein
MTIADLMLLAAIFVAISSIVPAKLEGLREYKNANPRFLPVPGLVWGRRSEIQYGRSPSGAG